MAEWLRKVMEEADRRYEELPGWKRASAGHLKVSESQSDDNSHAAICEPRRPKEDPGQSSR